MAPSMISRLSQLWPFSLFNPDDLKISNRLVSWLSIPEQAKQFVFIIPGAEKESAIYILAVQNLSEQSTRDADHLIKEIQPEAVVVQVSPSSLSDILAEGERLDNFTNLVPTSSYGVLRRCFNDKINRTQYEKLAGSLVLREIFGTGFHGHLLSSKRAAEEVDAQFMLLEYPSDSFCMLSNIDNKAEDHRSSALVSKFLVPQSASPWISPSKSKLRLSDPVHSQMSKLVSQSLSLSMPNSISSVSDRRSEQSSEDCQPIMNFQAPSFAHALYQLLADLHDIFLDLPSIKTALVRAQKILSDIDKGVHVDAQLLTEVHNFRVAIEGLRIAFNSASRCSLDQQRENKLEYDLLPPEEKCNALFAHALRSQANRYKSVVAVVDAGSLSSLRKHWNTTIPAEVSLLSEGVFIKLSEETGHEDGLAFEEANRKRLLADTPMVAVGAGATAIMGASSLSKSLPASTLVKLVSHKIPAIFKFGFTHIQRSAAIGLSKILTSSKVIAPGVASKASGLKVSASAEKIRRVTHGFIASVERTSLYAMRTAFYEIMRKRSIRPFRFAPWATFVGSTATCAGLVVYGDGIECAAESIPSAPVIASWGRGLESLHQASQLVGQTNRTRIQETLQSLMYNLKKMKVQ